jgi:hypothetical protein
MINKLIPTWFLVTIIVYIFGFFEIQFIKQGTLNIRWFLFLSYNAILALYLLIFLWTT